MRNILGLIILISFSTFSIAGISLNPQTINVIEMGWSAEGVYVHTNERLVGSAGTAEDCGGTTSRMPFDQPLFQENLSVLLSAFHAESKVRLYVDGCLGSSMYLKAVRIEK